MNPYRNEYGWRGQRGSYYGRGNVKFAILALLKEQPRHGYDIIREMEERSGGVYSPSPGVIYPTLQALEDQDYVKSAEQDGKKVYTITDEGRAFLNERKETMDKIKDHMRNWWGAENRDAFRDTMHEFRDLAHVLSRKAHHLDADKLAKIKEIIAKACRDIEAIVD